MAPRQSVDRGLVVAFAAVVLLVLVLPIALATPPSYTGDSNYGDYHNAASHYLEELPIETQAAGKSDDDLFLFFSSADWNRDHHLDGHELRNSFIAGFPDSVKSTLHLIDVEEMVDHALEEDDYDNDGRISWAEYLQSQRKHKQT